MLPMRAPVLELESLMWPKTGCSNIMCVCMCAHIQYAFRERKGCLCPESEYTLTRSTAFWKDGIKFSSHEKATRAGACLNSL